MISRPNWIRLKDGELNWSVFHTRALMLKTIRSFFIQNGFLEIEAPILTPYPTLDNHIESIHCDVAYPDDSKKTLFLHTSPEHAMKKCLAGGSGNIFFLGKVFRNCELTRLHNPEFTMAEWYRVNADYHEIMRDLENLLCHIADSIFGKLEITYQNQSVDLKPPWTELSVSEAFSEKYDLTSSQLIDRESLLSAAEKNNIHFSHEDDWETLFHRLFMEKIEPDLGLKKPLFLKDYPAEYGLMARCKPENPYYVERVELYISGMELANGYSELTEPEQQKARFMKQQSELHSSTVYKNIDSELIQALKFGLPDCAGIALGVDRLLMLFLDRTDIQDVLMFPHHQMNRK